LSLGSDEAKEDRPKSPWTPSYSVITQGNAVHEPAELDELDQLPPSVIESAQQLGSGTFVEAGTVEHSEPAAADAPVDIDHIDDRIRQAQPADIPATNIITAGVELTSATVIRVDTAVPKEEDEAILAVSSLSEDDIPPQASGSMQHEYHYLMHISVFIAVDSGHFNSKARRRRRHQTEIALDLFLFCDQSG